jgi:hypothetical protein
MYTKVVKRQSISPSTTLDRATIATESVKRQAVGNKHT